MFDLAGQKFMFAVAQLPFETAGSAGTYNQFCALLPLFDANAEPINLSDFPDNGDVWWMVRPGTRGLAEPGRLVMGVLENSVKQGTPGLAQYQVVADSVEPVRGRDYVEIITVPVGAISKPRDLVGRHFQLAMDHVPLTSVYVRWGEKLIGCLSATVDEQGKEGRWDVRFSPESADNSCLVLPAGLLTKLSTTSQLIKTATVSLERRPLHESTRLHSANYHLVETDALGQLISSDAQRISLKSDEQVVQQLAKRLLTRAKRQQLNAMLDELSRTAGGRPDAIDQEELEILQSLKSSVSADAVAVSQLADAIVKAGLVNKQIEAAIAVRVDQHISDNEARISSDINKKVQEIRLELESLQRDRKQIETELLKVKTQKKRELDQELEQSRKQFEQACKQKEDGLHKQLEELKRQQRVLSDNLQQVATKLANERDEVVNQFLTIAPLLGQLGLLPGAGSINPSAGGFVEETRSTAPRPAAASSGLTSRVRFHVPGFTAEPADSLMPEEEFLDRFISYVDASGFRYREIDLISFHMSVKCGDLTVLGGLPGTGKSTLTRLYANAIRGNSSATSPARFLHVAVSPSWLDMRDLMGHVNALNRTFQPADSSLYQQLIFAQEEFRQVNENSELYFVCLDEMNLSHVEHYFSGLLQVLEHPDGHRELRCFADHTVDESCDFAPWSKVLIPQSVRFIGTVNFDETTKQLSQRLLDRANVLRLPSSLLPLEIETSLTASLSGRPVRVRDYQSWIRNTAEYSDELATLVDTLKDDLRVLNCPMNPRRFSAMRKFLASWPTNLPHAEDALDLQIAQRVLPQIRGLFQPGSRRAVDSIRKKLESHARPFAESLRVLADLSESELSDLMLEQERTE